MHTLSWKHFSKKSRYAGRTKATLSPEATLYGFVTMRPAMRGMAPVAPRTLPTTKPSLTETLTAPAASSSAVGKGKTR